jgi:hypothetical protein
VERHDKQFSIPAPWPEKPGEETRVMIDSFGGGDYAIEVRGKLISFEWSEMFGPLPLRRDGSEMRSVGPNHPFWRAVSLWNLQGRRLDNKRAIWHEPKKPVLRHIAGRHYEVIEDGEPGYDW